MKKLWIIPLFLAIILFSLCIISFSDEDSTAILPPYFDLAIKPGSINETIFNVKGFLAFPGEGGKTIQLYLIPQYQKYEFKVNGKNVELNNDKKITLNRLLNAPDTYKIYFEGKTTIINSNRCTAYKDEIFCLAKCLPVPPNPEIASDEDEGFFYKLNFELPEGYSAIAPDFGIKMKQGIAFHIARFKMPTTHKTKNFNVQYIFPIDFDPQEKYLSFLENTLEEWKSLFGELQFNNIKVGAIKRGEAKGEISGSPCGNLILYSRTALGDKLNLQGLDKIGITKDISDQLRKLVIAHELAHFWFGEKYVGKDGWMVEGIPQYLGLYVLSEDNQELLQELIKMFTYIDKQGPQEPIPNSPFGEGKLYIKAYYQGPLALYKIGEKIGHKNLIKLIISVYDKNRDPSFSDFENEFKNCFSNDFEFWRKAWKMTNSPH